jgi:hypothetical protein
MAKNHNIRTACETLAGVAASSTISIGSVVPAGMTRYVTFIRVTQDVADEDEGSLIYLCSAATAAAASTDALASAVQKIGISMPSAVAASRGRKDFMAPPTPDTEHPLFTIGSAAYLRAHLSTAATMSTSVTVFVQYYEE